MRLGLIADIHGDYDGFMRSLELLDREGVSRIICAGDIVDRGPRADNIIQVLQERDITCIKGNHDVTVVRNQPKWRAGENPDRLRELGRIISDEAVAFLSALPESLTLTLEGLTITMGHGTPWSDIIGVFPDSRLSIYERVVERYPDTDLFILGHTHQPMQVEHAGMRFLNPGSIYGVTMRDSHTCAIINLPDREFRVFDHETGQEVDVPLVVR